MISYEVTRNLDPLLASVGDTVLTLKAPTADRMKIVSATVHLTREDANLNPDEFRVFIYRPLVDLLMRKVGYHVRTP